MQLLSYKNLSRNLASRVAERLFISCLCDSAGSDDSCENLIFALVGSHLVGTTFLDNKETKYS